jgi:outer membrane receptor protein involved in Fe transport
MGIKETIKTILNFSYYHQSHMFKIIKKGTLFLIFVPSLFFAQNTHSISGLVKESSGKGLPFANVLLLHQKDSAFVKGLVTQENGSYLLGNLEKGNYIIMASMVGYQSVYSKPFSLNSHYTVETLTLTNGELLDEVIVEATKALYVQKVDRMVINVASSIVSAGSSALEILERSPGVIVNRQSNNISVVGKDGVVVMINGKASYVPADALVQLLEGMSADNIESIELITTPPANFDAEGNAGFINIVLKKSTDTGLNGAYSFSAGFGNGEVTSDNLNFNYRKNKINFFGSYSFSLKAQKELFIASREYMKENNLASTYTNSDRDSQQRNHNARIGLDYEISDKTIMGVLLNAYDNKWSMDAFNESFDAENGIPISYVNLKNNEINQWNHFGVNYNIKHNFTADNFVSFDIDYLYYKDNNPNDYDNSFYDANKDYLYNELAKSTKITPIKTLVTNVDYKGELSEKLKLETGLKATFSKFENSVSVQDFVGSNWVIDPTLTNKSNLDEKIFASYGALDYSLNDKISMKFGLRYEYTDSQLDTDTEGKVIDKQYGIFFPSLFFNRKFNDNLNMNLSYSKRITRPTFNDLAPFVILLDPSTFISGNAGLQPAISNSVKYDINYKSIILSFQYTNEDFSIARFQEHIDEETNRLIFEASNLEYTKTFAVTFGLPIKINDWWRMQHNFNLIKQKVKGFYLDEPVVLSIVNFSANTTQSFKFSDSYSGEISAFYYSPSIFGTTKYNEVYGVNLGIQKKFGKKGGNLKFSISDIFDTIKYVGGTDLPDQNIKTYNVFDFNNRTYTLSYSRSFGNNKLKSSRERGTGADEERKRVN